MSVVGLFAGIGGFELAFQAAGFNTQMLVEIDPAASTVLKHRFPGVRIEPDVTLLDQLPAEAEIVAAGFPCQNLSMAGDKAGIKGGKSGAVASMFALIERADVPTVVIENVYFMLQLDRGAAMDWLVSQFEQLGYRWAYRVLDTMGFGLPHRRRRVYLVASKTIDPRAVLFADDTGLSPAPQPDISAPLGFYWTEGRSGVGFTVDGIPPLKVGSSLGIPSPPAVLFPDGELLTPSLRACEQLQGFPAGWTSEEFADEHERAAWRLVGNAVSVPVAAWIAQRIRSPGKVIEFETTPMAEGARWPTNAWNDGSGRRSLVASDKPISLQWQSIAEFRDDDWKRLSARALGGFIRRAREGRLTMPAGFLEALESAKRA